MDYNICKVIDATSAEAAILLGEALKKAVLDENKQRETYLEPRLYDTALVNAISFEVNRYVNPCYDNDREREGLREDLIDTARGAMGCFGDKQWDIIHRARRSAHDLVRSNPANNKAFLGEQQRRRNTLVDAISAERGSYDPQSNTAKYLLGEYEGCVVKGLSSLEVAALNEAGNIIFGDDRFGEMVARDHAILTFDKYGALQTLLPMSRDRSCTEMRKYFNVKSITIDYTVGGLNPHLFADPIRVYREFKGPVLIHFDIPENRTLVEDQLVFFK